MAWNDLNLFCLNLSCLLYSFKKSLPLETAFESHSAPTVLGGQRVNKIFCSWASYVSGRACHGGREDEAAWKVDWSRGAFNSRSLQFWPPRRHGLSWCHGPSWHSSIYNLNNHTTDPRVPKAINVRVPDPGPVLRYGKDLQRLARAVGTVEDKVFKVWGLGLRIAQDDGFKLVPYNRGQWPFLNAANPCELKFSMYWRDWVNNHVLIIRDVLSKLAMA